MRIVHFSDIHAWSGISDYRALFDKRLFGSFNYCLRRRYRHRWELVERAVERIRLLSPDIVICTGDLATISEAKEFEQALNSLTGLVDDHRFELIYVPGNHDYYVNSDQCRESLARAFYFLNREKLRLTDLPVALCIQHVTYYLINEAVPAGLFSSAGVIDEATQSWLLKTLDDADGDERAFLVHHYPLFDARGKQLSRRRHCRNNGFLQSAFRAGRIRFSLCGHIHNHFARWDGAGSVEFCAGSLTQTGKLNLIDYNRSEGRIVQRWVDVEGEEPGAADAAIDLNVALQES